jgi:hypothetical protein
VLVFGVEIAAIATEAAMLDLVHLSAEVKSSNSSRSLGSTNLADKTFTICCCFTLRSGHARNQSFDLLRLGIRRKDTRPFQAWKAGDGNTRNAWKSTWLFTVFRRSHNMKESLL